jgi:hypothetical protein
MTASHQFTEPTDWPTAADYADMDVHCVTSTARDVARYSGAQLAPLVSDLIEAREHINDAIAKAEAHQERATMARLPLEIVHVH